MYWSPPLWWIILSSAALIGGFIYASLIVNKSWNPGWIILASVLMTYGLIHGIVYFVARADVQYCKEYSELIGAETTYPSLYTGCWVKWEGQWIPDNQWIAVTS